MWAMVFRGQVSRLQGANVHVNTVTSSLLLGGLSDDDDVAGADQSDWDSRTPQRELAD